MPLTDEQILECAGHDDLLELLFSDLRVRMPPGQRFHMGRFLEKIRTIPIGLRSMAATFELDVSMTLDDLGWHFGNWTHRGYCDETLNGLRELEAGEYADMFAKGYELALTCWAELSAPYEDFAKSYSKSDFRKATEPLSFRWVEIAEDRRRHLWMLDQICAKISAQGDAGRGAILISSWRQGLTGERTRAGDTGVGAALNVLILRREFIDGLRELGAKRPVTTNV